MNIFKKKVGSTDNEISKSSNVNWNQITTLSQLNEIQEISKTKPAIIFKHSTTCMISRMALKNFEKEFEFFGSKSLKSVSPILGNNLNDDSPYKKIFLCRTSFCDKNPSSFNLIERPQSSPPNSYLRVFSK